MTIHQEFSAGGVVIRKDAAGSLVLLCLQQKLSGIKVYCLPKGHIEPGETPEEAALREVLEETGVTGRIILTLEPIIYHFHQQGKRIRKEVAYFLMECISENFIPNVETEETIWVGEEEADIADPSGKKGLK